MFEIWGAVFIIIFGVIGHFLYDFTNHNKFVGYFCAVNESTWEHIKLVIGPSFLWFIFSFHHYLGSPNLFIAHFTSLIVMMGTIPTLFYLYKAIFKNHNFIVNIIFFIIAVTFGQIAFYFIIHMDSVSFFLNHIGILGTLSIFIVYLTHTYAPDENFLTKDPITKKYGIKAHRKK